MTRWFQPSILQKMKCGDAHRNHYFDVHNVVGHDSSVFVHKALRLCIWQGDHGAHRYKGFLAPSRMKNSMTLPMQTCTWISSILTVIRIGSSNFAVWLAPIFSFSRAGCQNPLTNFPRRVGKSSFLPGVSWVIISLSAIWIDKYFAASVKRSFACNIGYRVDVMGQLHRTPGTLQ